MNEAPRTSWLQFRTSFLLCQIVMAGVALAGYRFEMQEINSPLTFSPFTGGFLSLTGPIVASIVLLLGRSQVTVPMAAGFVLSCAFSCCVSIASESLTLINPSWFQPSFLLGALFGLTNLLSRKITTLRLLLSLATCFCLGTLLADVFVAYLEWWSQR